MCSLSCSRSPYTPPTNKLTLLPNPITPLSGLTKFIAKNPFEADLISKLHMSVLSPTVFKVSSSSKKGSPGFIWTIDDLARLQPAEIDEFPIQQMDCSDSEEEKNAQEAIIKFFSENQIIPSPLDVKNNECDRLNEMQTPIRKQDDLNLTKEGMRQKKERKDNWAQTVLFSPPELPLHIKEIIKPYFNLTQDQNCQNKDSNSKSNTSLNVKKKIVF